MENNKDIPKAFQMSKEELVDLKNDINDNFADFTEEQRLLIWDWASSKFIYPRS